jgi:two-component system nitrate/nitrite response regulator NarL
MAGSELRFLREILRRELGEVRTFISQLRPPLLDELGLDGSIMDAVESMAALTGATVETELQAPGDGLNPTQQTAVLRIVQEALQNVRKHAAQVVPSSRHGSSRRSGSGGHGRRPRLRGQRGRRSRSAQLRSSVHAGASRADRCPIRGSIPAWRRNGRQVVDSSGRGERMSSMDYAGPDRRRPGPAGRTGEKTTILLVDDHALFRVGMRNILEREPGFEIIGEADDTRGAFDLSVQLSPDIILMDLSLPAPGGIETTQRIKRELPSAGIIVLAVNEDEDALFDAIKAGAAAFILKDVAPDDLVAIIHRVASGEYLINDKVFRQAGRREPGPQGVPRTGHLRPGSGPDLRPALAARSGDPRQHRPGHDQQAGRLRPVDQRADRQEPHVQHPAQAQRERPDPGRRLRHAPGLDPNARGLSRPWPSNRYRFRCSRSRSGPDAKSTS